MESTNIKIQGLVQTRLSMRITLLALEMEVPQEQMHLKVVTVDIRNSITIAA